ncbi:MAG: uncharacterized protein K0S45_795 [Nitrospira sp.]|jgi:predicted alpha/beta hydrolase family esterase|nr:uncharacterized protein [Nitrospira sp.]
MASEPVTADGTVALIVPGIGNSGPQHWQTLWEQRHPDWRRVPQRDWDRPICQEWLGALQAEVTEVPAPVVLVAHSIGCLLVAHWAHRSSVPVRAAFLVAIPDPDGPLFPAAAQGFQPVPLGKFGFPSLVVASSDDPFGSVTYARRCARGWGSGFVEIPSAGHINADSGLGDWPAGLALFEGLLKSS